MICFNFSFVHSVAFIVAETNLRIHPFAYLFLVSQLRSIVYDAGFSWRGTELDLP